MTQASEIKKLLTDKGINFKENQDGAQLVTNFLIGKSPVIIYPTTLKTVYGIKSVTHTSVANLMKIFTQKQSMPKHPESKFSELMTLEEIEQASDDARALLIACHAVEQVVEAVGMQHTKREILELAVKMVAFHE